MKLKSLTKKTRFQLWVVIIMLFITPLTISAQETADGSLPVVEEVKPAAPFQKWEAGLFLGLNSYLGDLAEENTDGSNSIKFPAIGLGIYRNLSETFALRGNLTYARLAADENDYDDPKGRGWAFENNIVELALMGQYEPFGSRRYGDNGEFNKILSPYVFAGVGLAFGTASNEDPSNALPRPSGNGIDEDEGSRFAIPLGLGLKYDLSRKVSLALELGVRPTLSDDLDGVSSSGNPDDNDWYGFGGLALNFRLGELDTDKDGIPDISDKCPLEPGIESMNGCPDADGDGIMDSADNCPNTFGQKVLNGCPDADGDGIADKDDNCPEVAGMRRFDGCPDTDGDEVIDSEDVCPNVAGLAEFSGCPDTDRDGIVDSEDKCPNQSGPKATAGCPDADRDGVLDADDKCPNKAGDAKFAGCPDTDGDGISDADDKCPTLAGTTANGGCPAIKVEDQKVLDAAMESVRFETGSARLRTSSRAILDQIAEVVKRYPGYGLVISGYTDNVGNEFTNQQLSENRAAAAVDYLASKGVPRNIMSSAGYGETNPIATNSTSAGRRLNRRVEFKLVRQ